MKSLILILSFFISSCNSKVNTVQHTPLTQYSIGVSFGSICCGTPDPDFLKKFITNYNKENSTSITADIVGGCGREGEFIILLNPGQMETAALQAMNTSLEKVVTATDSSNKTNNSSSGTLELLRNIKTEQYSYCRIALKKWL